MPDFMLVIIAFLYGMFCRAVVMVALRIYRRWVEQKRIREGHLKLRVGPGGSILGRRAA